MNLALFGIRKKFSNVKHLSTDELASSCESGGADGTLLLDTRAPEEFAVSRLANAINVDFNDPGDALEAIQQHKPARVVCYCSIGYRSSVLAQKLQGACEVPVFNLDGSIFKWANEGRQMVDSEGAATQFTHPYSSVWGKLLNTDLHKWEA